MIKSLNTTEFKDQIFDFDSKKGFKIKGGKAVIVDFWAPWCGPCRMITPILEQLDEQYEDIDIVKINVDDEHEVAAAFGIRSIPSLLFVPKDGEPEMVVGAQSKRQYERLIDELLSIKADT